MLRVDHQRWGQTVADLRHLTPSAAHPRSRERFLALHEIAEGSCATAVAERTGRRAQTVMGWLHAYNQHGPEALTYISAPAAAPPLCPDIAAALGEQVRTAQRQAASAPVDGADIKPRWTLRRLVGFVQTQFGRRCCRETIRRALHRLKLSWKKARKLLGRAEPANRLARHQSAPRPDPEQREVFVAQIGPLLDGARDECHHRVYLDEAHIHQDVDLGYGWGERGKRFQVASSSPGLKAKVSLYGLSLYNEGQVRIWP